jgi:hypothetical protein
MVAVTEKKGTQKDTSGKGKEQLVKKELLFVCSNNSPVIARQPRRNHIQADAG